MSEPECECSGPGFCHRYRIDQTEYAVGVCSGRGSVVGGEHRPCNPQKSLAYRRKWRLALTAAPKQILRQERVRSESEVSQTPRPPLPRPSPSPRLQLPSVRPACVHEGAVASYCTRCGNKESRHVRQCGHDDGPDLVVRGRVDGYPSCATCALYEPSPASDRP